MKYSRFFNHKTPKKYAQWDASGIMLFMLKKIFNQQYSVWFKNLEKTKEQLNKKGKQMKEANGGNRWIATL